MIKIKNLSLLLFSFMLVFAACKQDPEVVGEPPTADAGTDVEAVVGSTVQLSGTATDPDGDPLTISWTVTAAPSGSTASVNNASDLNARFTPDAIGNYTLTLSVSDGNGNTVTDEVIITAIEAVGEPPTAVIRNADNQTVEDPDNTVTINTPYELDAGNTSDPDTDTGDLTFTWEVTETPSGSTDATITQDASDPELASFVPDVVGEYTISLTVEDPEGNASTETVTIIADANPVEVGGTINEGTIWPNVFDDPDLPDYLVSSNLNVNEQLEVMPGVKVIFEPNTRMQVGSTNGAITALGKADSLIVFTAEDSLNGWQGIVIYNNNVLNQLDYVDVSYGGNADFDFGVEASNVGVENGDAIDIANSIISNSFGYGLFVENGGSLRELANTQFIDNDDHPIRLPIDQAPNIDDLSTFVDNDDNSVEISASFLNADDEVTIGKLAGDVPYFVSGRLNIRSGLSIAPGATFFFDVDALMYVESGSDGYISAIGTQTDGITFTAEDQTNGWGGIVVYTSFQQNDFQFCNISYGGNVAFDFGVEPANIGVENGDQIKISNSTISNSVGANGIFVENGGSIATFANNTFIDNSDVPLSIPISTAGVLDDASTFSGNGDNSVHIRASFMNEPQTLPALADGTPYFVSGKLDIDEALTISEGASFEFAQDAFLEIGTGSSISAIGTASNKITMTARSQADGWKGIVIYSNLAATEFDHVNISYGGNDGFDFGVEASCIGIENGDRAAITNTTFTNSFGFGLFVENGGRVTDGTNTDITTQAELEAAGNTFSDNADGPSNLPAN